MDEMILREESENLAKTLEFLQKDLQREINILSGKRGDLKDLNKDFWTTTSATHFDRGNRLDKERVHDMVQLLMLYNQTAHSADIAAKAVKKYERLTESAYFGRFDIIEEGFSSAEKIYVGFHSLIDMEKGMVYVYDWRSPIAGVYYRFELGGCRYDTPDGAINGEVTLKRHLKVEGSELLYYADSGLVIRDEILLEALSKSASDKMKTIVETIQKEQDIIIRDTKTSILIIQGAAGSGKTSIALHRAAYLLYETKTTGVTHRNILILSPNDVFAEYIDEVLPSLGEERVPQVTLDDLYRKYIKGVSVQTRYDYIENLTRKPQDVQASRQAVIDFKSSAAFADIIDKYVIRYERKLHKFNDLTLDGKTVFTREHLKALFLDNKAKLPAAVRLARIEKRVTQAIMPLFDPIREKLSGIMYSDDRHAFEEEEYTDKFLNKIRGRFFAGVRKMLTINPIKIYYMLISDKTLFKSLSPDTTDGAYDMFKKTRKAIRSGFLPYEDAAAVLYLTERLCGIKDYTGSKHVIIDEAQDYLPISYMTFGRLFPNAKYTILGDINQTIGTPSGPGFHDAASAMKSPRHALIKLSKSYRSSAEIHAFCQKIKGEGDSESFPRTGDEPDVFTGGRSELIEQMKHAIQEYESTGGHSIAVITKSANEASRLFGDLDIPKKTLLNTKNEKLGNHVNIMPCYMAKGLEFDFVLVWGADEDSYKSAFDRRLLYIACTRALHKLSVFAEGKLSSFVPRKI